MFGQLVFFYLWQFYYFINAIKTRQDKTHKNKNRFKVYIYRIIQSGIEKKTPSLRSTVYALFSPYVSSSLRFVEHNLPATFNAQNVKKTWCNRSWYQETHHIVWLLTSLLWPWHTFLNKFSSILAFHPSIGAAWSFIG